MVKQSRAWLLEPLGLAPCAVAEHEIMQHLNSARSYPVPFALRHCESAIIWQDQLVPLLNTGLLTGDHTAVRGLAVLAYQDAPGERLQYIALAIRSAPLKITVDDQPVCELPEGNKDLWQTVTKSCFRHEEIPTPILDIKRLCSAEFRDFAAQRLANLPEPIVPLIADSEAVLPEPAAANIEQAESASISVSDTVDINVGLAKKVEQSFADLVDDDEIEDEIDDLEELDDEDDDLDDVDSIDNELDYTSELADKAEYTFDEDLITDNLDETDGLADETNLDKDELDDDNALDVAAWLKEDIEDLDDDLIAEDLDETSALADDADIGNDTDLDELDEDELDEDELNEDELDEDELDDDKFLDDIAWLEDDNEAVSDDELELEDFAAVSTGDT